VERSPRVAVRSKRDRFLLLLALLVSFPGALLAKLPVLSRDNTFALSAPSQELSNRFSRLLDDAEAGFFKATGYAPGGFPPVIVVIHHGESLPYAGSENRLPMLRVASAEGGVPKIQADLDGSSEIDPETLSLLADAMLLREYYGKKSPQEGESILVLPPWLGRGMGRLCGSVSSAGSLPSNYLSGGVSPTIDGFLAQRPPQAESPFLLGVYDTMASSLLLAGLTESKQGGSGQKAFRQWIGTYEPDAVSKKLPDWPEGWSKKVIERRWLLLMAGTGAGSDESVVHFGVPETLAKYDEIMRDVPTEGHSLALLRKEKGAEYTAKRISERLVALRLQSNPLAIPLLDGTILLTANLTRLSPKKINEETGKLSLLREEIGKKQRAIESYMDWYEAARLPIKSGLFERLLHSPETSVKKGPVGRYIDSVEARGW